MKKTKVLIVAGTLGMGGLENQLVYAGKHIDRTRVMVDYSSTDPNAYYKEDILSSGCGFHVIPDPRKEGLLKYGAALYRLMKRERYDVVHSQELFHSGIEMLIAWLAGVPKRIPHSHSTQDGSRHNNIIKNLYHLVMRISILLFSTEYLACSTAAGQFLYGKNIVKSPKFRVVVNSVETSQYFEPNEAAEQPFEKKEGWRYIAHVGRFAEVKNHGYMLDIAAELKKQGLPIALVFVGNGNLFDECKMRAERMELCEHAIFLGQRKDVARILQNVDGFILPSHYEGMPLSVIEAQAAGLHCLVADHITDELDFSIGLLHKESITKPAADWAAILARIVQSVRPDHQTILRAIHAKGFDVSDFARNLCEIYCR